MIPSFTGSMEGGGGRAQSGLVLRSCLTSMEDVGVGFFVPFIVGVAMGVTEGVVMCVSNVGVASGCGFEDILISSSIVSISSMRKSKSSSILAFFSPMDEGEESEGKERLGNITLEAMTIQ